MTVAGRLIRTRFRGCLLGHACGDALGAAVEFLDRPSILARFGPHGVDGMQPWVNEAGIKLAAGSITDDTQMSIGTALGLLDSIESGSERAVWDPVEFVWHRYQLWLASQDQPRERRYPGATCLSAMRGGVPGDLDHPINDSKGSGGIMRVAPIGLALGPDRAFEHAAEAAALTHGHPSGYLAAGFFAEVVSRLVRGSGRGTPEWVAARGGRLSAAVEESREVLLGYEDHDEVLEAVDRAVELYMADVDLDSGIADLGEGWIAEEALGIALFCALNFPEDLMDGVLASVNITGDSDTTGCITGAILGALLGDSSIPLEWTSKLERSGEIMQLADRLYEEFLGTPVA